MKLLSVELINTLAADYVFGLHSTRVRKRIEKYRESHSMLDQAITYWEGRFAPLTLMLPDYEPGDRVWLGIQQAIHADDKHESLTSARKPQKKSLWQRLTSIDFFGGALSGAVTAVLLGSWIVNVIQPKIDQPLTPDPTPTVQEPQPAAPAEPKPATEKTGKQLPASYVGALTDATGKPRVVISSLRHGKKLDVKIIGELNANVGQLLDPTKAAPTGRKLYLWGLRNNGEMIRVGEIPTSGKVQLSLPETSEVLFADVNELAVTANEKEPPTTALTADTRFVVRGPCAKVW